LIYILLYSGLEQRPGVPNQGSLHHPDETPPPQDARDPLFNDRNLIYILLYSGLEQSIYCREWAGRSSGV